MKIPFWKMHGAGNDFILIDDRALRFPVGDSGRIRDVCTRRTGIGSEGLLLIQPSDNADFRMRFYNPDGSEAEMCGNGARCIARLAQEIGAAPVRMSMETMAGTVQAEVRGDEVCLQMTPPMDWRMELSLETPAGAFTGHHVNSGVPHVVIRSDTLDSLDIARLGRLIRSHETFTPAGANVNFVEITGPDALRIRTYERGVEAETLACGTGIVAAGLIAGRLGWVSQPVHITCAGGDVLTVAFRATESGAEQVTLTGPARHVFTGQFDIPES